MLAMVMIFLRQTAACQVALAKVVHSLPLPLLDGLPIEQWLQVNIQKGLKTALLARPDEQLAAAIRDVIAQAADTQK